MSRGVVLAVRQNPPDGGGLSDESDDFHLGAPSAGQRVDVIESLELIVNGKIVKKATQGGSEVRLITDLSLGESSWIALRAFEQSEGEAEFFGHTSPIYVSVDGLPIRVPEDIRYLLQKVDRLIEYTENVDGFAEERQRAETLLLYRQAREIYLDRLR